MLIPIYHLNMLFLKFRQITRQYFPIILELIDLFHIPFNTLLIVLNLPILLLFLSIENLLKLLFGVFQLFYLCL